MPCGESTVDSEQPAPQHPVVLQQSLPNDNPKKIKMRVLGKPPLRPNPMKNINLVQHHHLSNSVHINDEELRVARGGVERAAGRAAVDDAAPKLALAR